VYLLSDTAKPVVTKQVWGEVRKSCPWVRVWVNGTRDQAWAQLQHPPHQTSGRDQGWQHQLKSHSTWRNGEPSVRRLLTPPLKATSYITSHLALNPGSQTLERVMMVQMLLEPSQNHSVSQSVFTMKKSLDFQWKIVSTLASAKARETLQVTLLSGSLDV